MDNLFQFEGGDGQLLESLAYLMIVSGAIVFFILLYVPAPYGRYSRAELPSYMLHPSLAWMLQECPAFLVPAVGLWRSGRWSVLNANTVLLGYFMLHYLHR